MSKLATRPLEYLDTNNRKVRLTVEIVQQMFCPKATVAEAVSFMKVAQALGANPWLHQIYLIKYDEKSPAQIVVSRDFFLRLVVSNPNFRGLRSGVIVTRESPTGEITYEEVEGAFVPPGTKLYGGWCEIYLKNPDKPEEPIVIKQRIMLSEYMKNQASWKVIPATMAQKVAEAQAARKAFPQHLGGVYTPEEVEEQPKQVAATVTEETTAELPEPSAVEVDVENFETQGEVIVDEQEA